MIRKVHRDQVELGMFIHGFEGSWLSHPFWRKRFLLTDPDDLAKVRESGVAGVLIDEARGKPLDRPQPPPAHQPPLHVSPYVTATTTAARGLDRQARDR